jgi:hypothetical protein
MIKVLAHSFERSLLKFFGIKTRKLSASSQILLYLGLGMTGVNLVNSVTDVYRFSGTDLRIRIVGVRAMLQGIDPYKLDYSPKLPATLQDPDQYAQGVSRCPYPPSLLLFYAPLAPFPYPVGRGISAIAEWATMLATIALLSRTLRSERSRLILVIIGLICFSGSDFWRLHVERGQYHIFTTFCFAWGAYEILKKRKDSWVAGVPFGIALSFRPTIITILLFLWLLKYRQATVAAVTGASLIVLATFPFGGLPLWQSWKSLVSRYEDYAIGAQKNWYPIEDKQTAEGFSPDNSLRSKTKNSSVVATLQDLATATNIKIEPQIIKSLAKAIVVGGILLGSGLFVLAFCRQPFGVRFTVYAAIFVAIAAELVSPIRYGYADTQLLLLMAIPLPVLLRPSGRLLATGALIGFFSTGFMTIVREDKSDNSRPFIILGTNAILYTVPVVKRISKPTKMRQLK